MATSGEFKTVFGAAINTGIYKKSNSGMVDID